MGKTMQKVLFIGYLLVQMAFFAPGQHTRFQSKTLPPGCNLPAPSCTVFYAAQGEKVLAGSNEDSNYLSTNVIFLPGREGKFGRIYFGFDVANFPQGGMNEKGLFFDAVAGNQTVVVPRDPGKPQFKGQLILKAMEECATVEEVRKIFTLYDFSGPMNGQYLVGDRFGNSMIIAPLGIFKKKGTFQIVTNFQPSKTSPQDTGEHRYRIASYLLKKSTALSIDLFRRVLNATHCERTHGDMNATLYSYICDLKKGDVYIYNFHNFEEVMKINLKKELKKGRRICPVLSLFPYMTYAEGVYRFKRIRQAAYERAIKYGMKGDDGVISLYKSQLNIIPKPMILDLLAASGRDLLEGGKLQEALDIFKFTVKEEPGFSPGYEGLAAACLKKGDKKGALEHYRKVLELDPENSQAKEMLKKLEEK